MSLDVKSMGLRAPQGAGPQAHSWAQGERSLQSSRDALAALMSFGFEQSWFQCLRLHLFDLLTNVADVYDADAAVL